MTLMKCIISISEARMTKRVFLLNEFTLSETSAGDTLLYIANHPLYKRRNDLNIYKKNE